MKRMVLALLCLLLAAAPALAGTQTAVYALDEYEYTLNADGTAVIFRYLGSADAPTIPAALDGHNVTGIGKAAFYSLRGIRSLALPDSVTAIAPGAFACKNIARITAGAGNTAYAQIDGVLFDKAGKTLHTFPADCADKTYDIPGKVLMIGELAFADCVNLTSVKIPDSWPALAARRFRDAHPLNPSHYRAVSQPLAGLLSPDAKA
jgi:hypothetical protein